jgi:hypothetical protein
MRRLFKRTAKDLRKNCQRIGKALQNSNINTHTHHDIPLLILRHNRTPHPIPPARQCSERRQHGEVVGDGQRLSALDVHESEAEGVGADLCAVGCLHILGAAV